MEFLQLRYGFYVILQWRGHRDCVASNCSTDEIEMEKDLEGKHCVLAEVLSRHLSKWTEERDRNHTQGSHVPANSRTEHFPNASLQRYRFPSPGVMQLSWSTNTN
jgi:hypothetical protein